MQHGFRKLEGEVLGVYLLFLAFLLLIGIALARTAILTKTPDESAEKGAHRKIGSLSRLI